MSSGNLLLELSNNCNLACAMCGFGGERIVPEKFMSEQVFTRVLETVRPSPTSVRLNGRGESTIHPRFTLLLARIAEHWPGADLHLFTNLNTSNPEVIASFIRCNVLLFVSIDSPVKGELEGIRRGADQGLIEANLSTLSALDRRPYVVFTVQESNVHRIIDIARYAARWKAGILYNVVRHDIVNHRLTNYILSNYARVRDAFIEAAEIMDAHKLPCLIPDKVRGVPFGLEGNRQTQGGSHNCLALEREACILHNGDVTPCNMFNPFIYGNIMEHDFWDILAGPRAAEFKATRGQSAYCRDCAWMGEVTA